MNTLQRLPADHPDFATLNRMLAALRELLESPSTAALRLEELLAFQCGDGSFQLLDSCNVPGDARVDFCHVPTYIGAAILMREYLGGRTDLAVNLETALNASTRRKLAGHGYDAGQGRAEALEIFAQGGLPEFLQSHREICPRFHAMLRGKRLYAAYGSNMNKEQMARRCPDAVVFGKGYALDYELTMPFYANLEPAPGKRAPVLLWELTENCEQALDRYEGFPELYRKTTVTVDMGGQAVVAMAYIMTEAYQHERREPREGYLEAIRQGYRDAGFPESVR